MAALLLSPPPQQQQATWLHRDTGSPQLSPVARFPRQHPKNHHVHIWAWLAECLVPRKLGN